MQYAAIVRGDIYIKHTTYKYANLGGCGSREIMDTSLES